MAKLASRTTPNVGKVADYASVEEMLRRTLADVQQQNSNLQIQNQQLQERMVREESQFRAKLQQEEAEFKKGLEAKKNDLIQRENAIKVGEADIGARERDLENQINTFNAHKEKLKKLGLLQKDEESVIKMKKELIQQKADFQILEQKIADDTDRLAREKKDFQKERVEIEKLRGIIDELQKKADLKMLDADSKIQQAIEIKEEFSGAKKILKAMKEDADMAIEQAKAEQAQLKALKENSDKSSKSLIEKLKKVEEAEKSLEKKMVEVNNAIEKEEKLAGENSAILESLLAQKKSQEEKERDLITRETEVARRELKAGIKK